MDLYRKVERQDGSVEFQKLETPPSREIRQLAANLRFLWEELNLDVAALIPAIPYIIEERGS